MSAIKRVYEFKEEVDSLTPNQLENFVFDILVNTGRFTTVKKKSAYTSYAYDLYATEASAQDQPITWLIEIKQNDLMSIDIIKFLKTLLNEIKYSSDERITKNYKLLIVSLTSFTKDAKKFAIDNDIELWSIYTLYEYASEDIKHKHFYSLEEAESGEVKTESRNNDNDIPPKAIVSNTKRYNPETGIDNNRDYYCNLLQSIKPGREEWSRYQKTISDIFEYLFNEELGKPYYESSDADKRNRRDIIIENNCETGFWNSIRNDYSAHYIVIDAKNYSEPVGKKSVIEIAHYLKPRGCGMFGILVTREGIDESGNHATKEIWTADAKMIVALSDEDVVAMLNVKAEFGKPGEIIRQKIMRFRLSI